MTESACTPYGIGQLVNFHEFYRRDGFEHHLGNAFITLNCKWLLSTGRIRASAFDNSSGVSGSRVTP